MTLVRVASCAAASASCGPKVPVEEGSLAE